jgi:aryl-alcohol dehydrogenase-like predicted oxidoreductase
MTQSTPTLGPTRIAWGERPFRREPGTAPPDSDIYLAPPDARAEAVRAALDAGIACFHAAYEREAQSLGTSLRALGVRDRVLVSTTDGDVLDRCPDTEEGAAQAIRAAIARKRELLGVDILDVFLLYDFRPEVHTPARLAGARRALSEARAAGTVRHTGATCYAAFDALADALETDALPLDAVAARYNYADQSAASRLLPACRARGVLALAAQTFSWLGGVPFVRFPNTWRFRNLTKNFYGFSAAQAHLHWVLSRPDVDGALVSMQTAAQAAENLAAAQIAKAPQGLESLFDSFLEAMTRTREGWRGLLADELWEHRAAAEAYLHRRKATP